MTDTLSPGTLPSGFGERWVTTMFDAFLHRTDALGDLDRQSGDGDFGSNISSALGRAKDSIRATAPTTYTEWVTAVSRGFLGTGGTSGPLFGMFFRDIAKAADAGEPSLTEFAAGLASGVATVQRYGKAEVGHKTMVDAGAPAAEVLTAQAQSGATTDAAFTAAADAAIAGALSTSDIVALRGRASYVGEVSRGVLDPGAVAVAIMIQSAAVAAGAAPAVDAAWMEK